MGEEVSTQVYANKGQIVRISLAQGNFLNKTIATFGLVRHIFTPFPAQMPRNTAG
jgi:hypothetical protein